MSLSSEQIKAKLVELKKNAGPSDVGKHIAELQNKDILNLNTDLAVLQQWVTQKKPFAVVVLAHSPGCGWCTTFAPSWWKFAPTKDEKSFVQFAMIEVKSMQEAGPAMDNVKKIFPSDFAGGYPNMRFFASFGEKIEDYGVISDRAEFGFKNLVVAALTKMEAKAPSASKGLVTQAIKRWTPTGSEEKEMLYPPGFKENQEKKRLEEEKKKQAGTQPNPVQPGAINKALDAPIQPSGPVYQLAYRYGLDASKSNDHVSCLSVISHIAMTHRIIFTKELVSDSKHPLSIEVTRTDPVNQLKMSDVKKGADVLLFLNDYLSILDSDMYSKIPKLA